ncbi:MAG: c-type cytochrome [Halocynthiibacter sp.]
MRYINSFSFGLIALAGLGVSGTAWAVRDSQPDVKPAQAESTENIVVAVGPETNGEDHTRGLLMPYIDPAKGRMLFASKGCVVCHSINGIGGTDAPPMDAKNMPPIMNPFDFAAKMWLGAGTMISMQEDELGEQIEFNGDELINIIAFVHDINEQKKFSEKDIPERIKKLMGHLGDEDEEHETKEHN